MGYKLIIFDLDGTLVDAYKAIEVSFNYTMRALGLPKRDSLTIRKSVGWGDENLLRPFIKGNNLAKALKIYRNHHKVSLLKYSRLYPGVRRLLSILKKKGYRLAIASNRPTPFTNILLEHLGLRSYFNLVLCADRLKYIKPNPQILIYILKRLRVSSKEALYVGDMTVDIQAGKSAKLDTVAVVGGSSTIGQLKKERPTKIISNITHLPGILN